ncbi:MAG TPA: hypothetical protein EYP71_04220 [Dehalococcoidia bacterium]|nr:hypothetical protein [Dehalococcoidia bacterium]
MQQTFLCPACGAENLIGQEFCQACGQRFQYNCPYCGTIVDSTLVNCPGCRESLYWPTPRRVPPFPKQRATYRTPGGIEPESEKPQRQKSDPWLIGCLGAVIVAILILGAYFVYDNFIKTPAPVLPTPSVSENQTSALPLESIIAQSHAKLNPLVSHQ